VLANVLQLPGALEQKEQLGLQRRCSRVLIKAFQERIFVGLLENQLAAETARQASRETGLADADGSFNHDEAMRRRDGSLVCHVHR
jgi:hypothetical protein